MMKNKKKKNKYLYFDGKIFDFWLIILVIKILSICENISYIYFGRKLNKIKLSSTNLNTRKLCKSALYVASYNIVINLIKIILLLSFATNLKKNSDNRKDSSSPTNNMDPSSPTNNMDPSSPTNNMDPSSPTNNMDPSSPTNNMDPSIHTSNSMNPSSHASNSMNPASSRINNGGIKILNNDLILMIFFYEIIVSLCYSK